jgi:hypothetical protein
MHDGRVDLTSEGAGKGTIVRVRLPLREEPARLGLASRARADAGLERPSLH